MENFVVSARKYRPDRFDTVVGQPSITTTLKNAIESEKLAHAYLFCGPRGVGKTTCARIFAKTINCSNLQNDTEACGECDSCQSFSQNRSYSIHELDAASNNSVEDIRNLIDQVRIPPQVGKYSIYIIDEVHMLSQAAFNSFLKTLEEPPAHAIFILATTEKHKIIPTILSRCQIFDFNRIGVPEITDYLKLVSSQEEVISEEAALNIIAYKADGSMRDALSIFDQVVSFSGKEISYQNVVSNLNVLDHDYYFKLTDAFMAGNYKSALIIYNEILSKGFDSHNLINGLAGHFRNLMVSKDPETITLMELGGEIAERYQGTATACTLPYLYESLSIINQSDIHFKQAKDPRLHVEICLLKLCSLSTESPLKNVETFTPAPQKKDQPEKRTETKSVSGPEAKTEKKAEKDSESIDKQLVDKKIKAEETQSEQEEKKTEKTEKTVSNTSTRNGIKTTPRLSDYLNKEKEVHLETIQAASAVDDILELNESNLKKIWNQFADGLKNEQPRLYNTLIAQNPIIKDNKIIITLSNPLQVKALDDIHYDLENFLNKSTGKSDLKIEKVVEKKVTVEKKVFTQDEKYTHLRDKNPVLDQFRQNFKLDFE